MRALDPLQRALRLGILLWLIGWGVKLQFLLSLLGPVDLRYPVVHPLFQGAFAASGFALACYLLPFVALPLILGPSWKRLQVAAALLTGCAALLTLHVNTFNDATFVTGFWSGLWLLWLACLGRGLGEDARTQAPRLAQCIIALMFLGGALGKLTAEYWSGEVLLHVYFLQKSGIVYPWLRETLPPDSLARLACWFSRAVVLGELAMSASFLVPRRFSLPASIGVMLAIVAMSSPLLLSVMLPLIGIAAASLVLLRTKGPLLADEVRSPQTECPTCS